MAQDTQKLRELLSQYIGDVYAEALQYTNDPAAAKEVTRRVMTLLKRSQEAGLAVNPSMAKRLIIRIGWISRKIKNISAGNILLIRCQIRTHHYNSRFQCSSLTRTIFSCKYIHCWIQRKSFLFKLTIIRHCKLFDSEITHKQ